MRHPLHPNIYTYARPWSAALSHDAHLIFARSSFSLDAAASTPDSVPSQYSPSRRSIDHSPQNPSGLMQHDQTTLLATR